MFEFLNIKKLNGRVSELQAQCEDWSNKYTTLEAAYNDMKSANETFLAEKEAYNKQVEEVKAQYEAEIAALKAEKAKTEQQVEAKAADIVAAIGMAQETLPPMQLNELTPEQILAKWQDMQKTDAQAASAYYKANREVLMNFVGFRK